MPSTKRFALLLAAAAVLVVAGLGTVPSAGAGPPGELDVALNPGGNQDQAVFLMNIQANACVSDPQVTVPGVPDVVVALTDPNTGTITFPVGTPGGSYQVDVTCETADGPASGSAVWDFASVNVIKVVEGDAAPDARFSVRVTCVQQAPDASPSMFRPAPEGLPFIQADLSFGATGGDGYLVAYNAQDCTVAEIDTGGAVDATVATEDCDSPGRRESVPAPSGTFTIAGPYDCTQTVTNEFADVPPPTPPGPTPPGPPTPVPLTPRFTG